MTNPHDDINKEMQDALLKPKGLFAETGTPVPPPTPDPDIDRAKRMVTRLHVNAHDARGERGGFLTAESFADVCTDAADVIELLIGKLR